MGGNTGRYCKLMSSTNLLLAIIDHPAAGEGAEL